MSRKPNYAEAYMQHVAVRNAISGILRTYFGGRESRIAKATDEILAIDPAVAYKAMMAGEQNAAGEARVGGAEPTP